MLLSSLLSPTQRTRVFIRFCSAHTPLIVPLQLSHDQNNDLIPEAPYPGLKVRRRGLAPHRAPQRRLSGYVEHPLHKRLHPHNGPNHRRGEDALAKDKRGL